MCSNLNSPLHRLSVSEIHLYDCAHVSCTNIHMQRGIASLMLPPNCHDVWEAYLKRLEARKVCMEKLKMHCKLYWYILKENNVLE